MMLCCLQNEHGIFLPQGESRQFKALTLDNGLRCVIISDPQTTLGAACMTVHAGNMNDPAELPGCAHFTEHMLFLGTEKYPVEGDYKRYLLEHGGAGNASTGLEHTKYHFRVQSAFLEGALDRFAQFFISPSFAESATEREISAVESEYAKNLQIDSRQKFQLMRHMSDPCHPYNRFGSGNRATLAEAPAATGLDARARMMQWYREHYCTDAMTLCVYGDGTMDELEAMVRSMFQAVPQRTPPQQEEGGGAITPAPTCAPHTALAEHGLPFKLAQSGVVATINPVRQLRSVHVSWHLPHRPPGDTARPYRLLSHLLGHEGKGSILAALKQRNLATGLSASTISTTFQSNCSITVVLTPEGERQWTEVLRVVYAYAAKLRRHAAAGSMPPHVWGDMAQRNATQFRFKTPANAQDTARAVALSLQYSPPALVEYAPYSVADSLPVAAWAQAVQCLTPQNAVTVRVGQLWGDLCTDTEKWFGARYCVQPASAEQLQLWGALPAPTAPPVESEEGHALQEHAGLPGLQFPVLPPSEGVQGGGHGDGTTSPARFWVWPCAQGWAADLGDSLHLPEKNAFMADDFSLAFPAAVGAEAEAPVGAARAQAAYTRQAMTAGQCGEALLVKAPMWPTPQHAFPMVTPLVGQLRLPLSACPVRVWSRPDGPWRLPKAVVTMAFQLPAAAGVTSAKQEVLGALYTLVVQDALSHVTYDAELGGMHYHIARGDAAFTLQVSGFSQRLHILAQTVLSELVPAHDGTWAVPEAVFRRQRERLARQLASKAAAQPRVHAVQQAVALVVPSYHTPQQLLQALQSCTSADLSAEVHRIWHSTPPAQGIGGSMLVDVVAAGNVAPSAVCGLAEAMLAPFDAACARVSAEVSGGGVAFPGGPMCDWMLQSRAVQLPPGIYRHTSQHPNPADTNSAVVFTYQLGAAGDDEVSVLASTAAALMRQRCFDILRTKEQLGYIVSSGCTVDSGVRCLRLVVQSATASVAFVEWRMHAFLRTFRDELQEMATARPHTLDKITSVLRSEWLNPPKTWSAWASAAVRPVAQGTFDFTQALRLAQLSHSVTPEALLAFYDACFLLQPPPAESTPGLSLLACAQGVEGGGGVHWQWPTEQSSKHVGPTLSTLSPAFAFWTQPAPSSGAGGGAVVDGGGAAMGRCRYSRLLIASVYSRHPQAPQPAVALFNQLERSAVQAAAGHHAYKHSLLDVPESGPAYAAMQSAVELSSVPAAAVHAGALRWWAHALQAADAAAPAVQQCASFPSRQEQGLLCPPPLQALPAALGEAL